MPKRSSTIKFVSLFLMIVFLLSPVSFAAAAASSTTSIYFNGKRITSIDSNSTRLYYHQDYLGSARIVTDRNGAQSARLDYEPFGRELVDSTKTRYKFTGKEEDATGYDYFGARYYDSDTGRFTQIDPRYDAGESPYAYAANNPMKFVDPDGHDVVPAQTDTVSVEYRDISEFPDQNFLVTRQLPASAEAINKFLPAEVTAYSAAALVFIPGRWPVYVARTFAAANFIFNWGKGPTDEQVKRANEEVAQEILDRRASGDPIWRIDNPGHLTKIRKSVDRQRNIQFAKDAGIVALTVMPWKGILSLLRKGPPVKALEPVETGRSTLLKHVGPHVPTSGPAVFQTPWGEVSAVTRKQAMGNQGAPPLITQDGKPVNSLVGIWMRTYHPDLWPR